MTFMPDNFTPIKDLEEYLRALADSTSPTAPEIEKIITRYQSVGGFLDRDESGIKAYNPRVYPQGSVLLGTTIRPLNDKDDLDVDLVCLLRKGRKSEITQAKLKSLVAKEIKLYAASTGMLEPNEGRRCTTLIYRDTIGFHIDILPAIPDASGMRSSLEKQC